MSRDYVIRRRRLGDIEENLNGEDYLARTVHEDVDLIDVGLLDPHGNAILARKKMDAIGFVRWKA